MPFARSRHGRCQTGKIARLQSVRGRDTGIHPGVPVQVTVKLRRRTALEYMIEPLTSSMTHALSER